MTDIMNKKPQLAWKLYLKMETSGESFNLLQLIANDCYKVSLLFFKKKKKLDQSFSMILHLGALELSVQNVN